jgi:hypothetical protein
MCSEIRTKKSGEQGIARPPFAGRSMPIGENGQRLRRRRDYALIPLLRLRDSVGVLIQARL